MSLYSYYSTLPNPPDDPGDDIAGMQTNSASISGLISEDHVGFNSSLGGYHSQVTFAANNIPSVPTSPPVLFTNTVNALPQLFFYSGDASHGSSQYVSGSNGSVLLFGGIIMKWFNTVLTGASNAITFTSAGIGNFPNGVFGASVTAQSATAVGYGGLTQTGITVLNSTGGTVHLFVVILGN